MNIIGKLNDWTLFVYKIYLDYFLRRLKLDKLGKSIRLTFWVPVPRVFVVNTYILLFCIDLSTKPYQGLWFNGTHLPLFQKLSVKIYSIFFLSSGGSNFKINYSKDKMRYGMWVHILQNNLALSPLQHEYYSWHRRSKCHEKTVKFYREIFEFKVFVRSNN